MAGSTDSGSISDKCSISGVGSSVNVSVIARIFFVRGSNTAMKMNGDIAGDSATGRNKFTARKWAALIGICSVETRNRVQNIRKKIENACDATAVRTILVTAIKEQQVDVDRQSIWVWFGDDVAENIWKYRFTYGLMANMTKLSGASQLWFSFVGLHSKFGIWRRLSYKKNASIISPHKF